MVVQLAPLVLITFKYHWYVLLSSWIDKEGVMEYRLGKLFAREILKRTGQEVEVVGAENVKDHEYFAVASNHASYLDFAVLLAFFPTPLRFIAKKELRRIPVIGKHLVSRGVVIDRKDRRSAFDSITAAIDDKNPIPILIFPEGTRSADGKPRPFKRGGLFLFAKSNVPIVPVTIINSAAHLPRGAINYLPGGKLKMVISPAVELKNFSNARNPEEAMIDAIEQAVNRNFTA